MSKPILTESLQVTTAATSGIPSSKVGLWSPTSGGNAGLPVWRMSDGTDLALGSGGGGGGGPSTPGIIPAGTFTMGANPTAGDEVRIVTDDGTDYYRFVTALGAALTVQATGVITPQSKTGFANGQTFVISDGVNPPTTFAMNVTGSFVPPGGQVAIDISTDNTGALVATRIGNAINAIGAGLAITALPLIDGGLTLPLINDSGGAMGNVPIVNNTTGFDKLGGMSGGSNTGITQIKIGANAGATLSLLGDAINTNSDPTHIRYAPTAGITKMTGFPIDATHLLVFPSPAAGVPAPTVPAGASIPLVALMANVANFWNVDDMMTLGRIASSKQQTAYFAFQVTQAMLDAGGVSFFVPFQVDGWALTVTDPVSSGQINPTHGLIAFGTQVLINMPGGAPPEIQPGYLIAVTLWDKPTTA